VKPVIAVLWIISIALAVGLTRLAGPDRAGSEPGPSLSSEPSPSLDEAFAEFDPLRRPYLITYALQDFGPDDLPELHRVLVDRRLGIVREEVRMFMLAWARFDGPGAYAWASQGPMGWRPTLTGEAIFAWAYHDGAAAMAVVDETEDPERRTVLRQQALDGWMHSDDKQGVADYLITATGMKRRARFYNLLGAEVVMREGTDAAMRWVEALPDDTPKEQQKSILFKVVAKLVAGEDPVRAAEWFLAHRTQPYSKRALTDIATRWVQNRDNAPAAFEWLLAMSSDGIRAGERDDAIARGFRSWIQSDPEGAQQWLLSMLPNPELEVAIREAIKRLLPKPGAAMPWARRLNGEAERHAESVRVGIRWRDKDQAAFNDWLKENDLPEEIRQKILAAPQPTQRGVRMKVKPQPAAAQKR
jgi:hypothetical protein